MSRTRIPMFSSPFVLLPDFKLFSFWSVIFTIKNIWHELKMKVIIIIGHCHHYTHRYIYKCEMYSRIWGSILVLPLNFITCDAKLIEKHESLKTNEFTSRKSTWAKTNNNKKQLAIMYVLLFCVYRILYEDLYLKYIMMSIDQNVVRKSENEILYTKNTCDHLERFEGLRNSARARSRKTLECPAENDGEKSCTLNELHSSLFAWIAPCKMRGGLALMCRLRR